MAKVGIQRAAELTGKSKSTIQRSLKNGKLSFDKDTSGRRVIDVSELDRVFGLVSDAATSKDAVSSTPQNDTKLQEQTLEIERLKMQVTMLTTQLDDARDQIIDLKAQRDQWQKQASQVLITSQFSQDEARNLRDELTRRKEQMILRKKQIQAKKKAQMERKIQSIQADNENIHDDEVIEQRVPGQLVKFWGKLRGKAA